MKWRSIVFSSVVGLLGLAASSSAATIIGHLNASTAMLYDTRGAATGLSVLDFAPTGGGSGQVVNLLGMTGYFAGVGCGEAVCLPGDGLTSTSTALILDLTNDPTAAPPATFAPSGVDILISNFLSAFSDPDAGGIGGLHFNLLKIPDQVGTPCTGLETIGDSCVEGPFSILDTNQGVRFNIDFFGEMINGADSGFFVGSFASTFAGLHFQGPGGVFDRLDNTGLNIGCGPGNLGFCSGDFNLDPFVVPEPASLLTFGAGAALLAVVRRRRAVKAEKV